ncbi:putative P2Y purinoceptor 10 [Osmerus eperlanus]|uniref:putative P2Y purinoceptor 10 n=1 Tax=Osmerus eperlanus TaxID=29151 RepID=UPI002E0FC5F3
MYQNASALKVELLANSSSQCTYDLSGWEQHMDQLYTYFYLVLFVPGLLLNATALWVLCTYIRKKTKAVIFMMNLALADLAHVLSLPLRIYYYFTHSWPFGQPLCLFCFYLKYLNMYASIFFLVCISVQRCVFLLKPFCARRWRRRYDMLISASVWLVAGLGCSPFILMRSSTSTSLAPNASPYSPSTPGPAVNYQAYVSPLYTSFHPSTSLSLTSLSTPRDTASPGCFKDLPTRRLPLPLAAAMMSVAELFGFLLPLLAVSYSSYRIARSLGQKQDKEERGQTKPAAHTPATRPSSSSFSSSSRQTDGEKRRGLRMVLSCAALFLVCFVPYHLNFLLYLMVSQGLVSHCPTQKAVRQFHPVSLCLASVSCCLNPLLYYFLTAEFRMHLRRRTSSYSSFLLSSPPCSSPQSRPTRERLTSMESVSSYRE